MAQNRKVKEVTTKRRRVRTIKTPHIWNTDHDDGDDAKIRDIAIRDADRAFERHVKELRNSS